MKSEWDKVWEDHPINYTAYATQEFEEYVSWIKSVKEVGDKLQDQNKKALQRTQEWCDDCLKPKYACPSCIYQLTKEALGYRPRLSMGEKTIESDKLRSEGKP